MPSNQDRRAKIIERLDYGIGTAYWHSLPEIIVEILNLVEVNQNDCWVYKGTCSWINGEIAYGTITYRGVSEYTHHLMWKAYKGKIPKDKWLLHRCNNKPCCNPSHLYIGTAKQNTADAIHAGRHGSIRRRV